MNDFFYIIGLDIGNSTTKAVLLEKNNFNNNYKHIDSDIVTTTGIKGTIENFIACKELIEKIINRNQLIISKNNISIKINHAAPVISDLSVDTISETRIIDSAMIGHNPDTPGGEGIAFGQLIWQNDFIINKKTLDKNKEYIIIIDDIYFIEVVNLINSLLNESWKICGLIIKNDDAVLISNRIIKKIPILDEVSKIHKLLSGNMAAIEVAKKGSTLKILSDPYEIATLFKLNAEETQECILIAKNLTGKRSGVIIKTNNSKFITNKVKAGFLDIFNSENKSFRVDVNSGSKKIMRIIKKCDKIIDVIGESGSNSQILINKIKQTMANLTNEQTKNMKITDLLAVDTFKSSNVLGSLADESIMESVVMLAAQVQTSKLAIDLIAEKIKKFFNISTNVFGYEAEMAIHGALTTPGTAKPLVILDLGGGSTDAAIIDNNNKINMIHCAGAGDMVTKIIDLELNLNNIEISELIKRYPLAKVTGLLTLKFENDDIYFLKEPLPSDFFSKIVILKDNEYIPIKNIDKQYTLEKIVKIRRKAKQKIFLVNALRALYDIAPNHDLTNIKSIVLVGGSSQDFEITDILYNGLIDYRITIGKAKLMGILPAYYAVALGLAIS